MTQIDFHFNAVQKIAYGCKLVRKAVRKGSRVTVVAAPDELHRLDVQLWEMSPTDFVPHLQAPVEGIAAVHTPVLLCANCTDSPQRDVLVNLGQDVPQGFEQFARLVEIVSGDEADRQAARLRWKHYAKLGYTPTHHDVATET